MNTNIINAIANGVAAATASNPNKAAATNNTTNTTGAGGEKDMFMKLLVAQLKQQDPLSPQDGTQFVTQLAQFNSLDQLIGIRTAIDGLTKAVGGSESNSTQTK